MPNEPCSIPGCQRPLMATGLCRLHYDRRRRGSEHADTPGLVSSEQTVRLSLRVPASVCQRLHKKAKASKTPLATLVCNILAAHR